MPKPINRRGFLMSAAAAGAAVSLGRSGSSARASSSPNEKLNIAMIGAGGRGAANLEEVAGENIVALCDVDERRAGVTFQRYPYVKKYHDFRRMLEEMEREIDAVVVSAPNHIHVPASVMAIGHAIRPTCRMTGTTGGTSALDRWATWAAITWTSRFGR